MGKILLNQSPGEPLALMKKLSCFDEPIELQGLLAGVLCLSVHDPINFPLFDVVRIESCNILDPIKLLFIGVGHHNFVFP
jgi:hypothetical protein